MGPLHLLALLLFVVLAAKGESECPKEKTVGDTCFQLVAKGIDTSQYGCKDGCVYTRSGRDRVCFKKGDLPVLDTCPAKNQTQEIMNERLVLLETTAEALLDMAKRSVYQPRPKEEIMDCQNRCMMDETIETFQDFRNCSQTCISQFSTYTDQTPQCMAAGAPLKGRCIPKNTHIPPKIKAAVKIDETPLCNGDDECAIYRWKCNTTANIDACTTESQHPKYGNVWLAAPFPGEKGTYPYLQSLKPAEVEGMPIGTGGIFGTGNCGCIHPLFCVCDCTCLIFSGPMFG